MSYRQIIPAITFVLSFLCANLAIAQNTPSRNTPPAQTGTSNNQRIISQIHNAPGWLHSHRYAYAEAPFTRVINGPGWDEAAGKFAPGRPLDAYQLVSTGSCESAGSGGPAGAGDTIADGTCTWKHLSTVDYISIAGWAFDNQSWKPGSAYHYFDAVTSDAPLRAYALLDDTCASKVAPKGTGSKGADLVAEDGCHWRYLADITYSSEKSYIPAETFPNSKGPATLAMRATYEAQLWNDREYVAGEGGETVPIRTQAHNDFMYEGGSVQGGPAKPPYYHIVITTARGESFSDRLNPDLPLTGYDPHTGVALRNDKPYQWPYEPSGFDVHDNLTNLVGLQIKSVHGPAVSGMTSFGNAMLIEDCILEGGSEDEWTSHAAVTTDTSSVIANSLVISHAPIGVVFKYPGVLLHSTIVLPDRIAESVGIDTTYSWVYDDTMVSNTAIFGFAHAVAHHQENTSWSAHSANNKTDAPTGDSGRGAWPFTGKESSIVDTLPGTAYGVSSGGVFANFGKDWRLKSGSPLIGAGRAVGSFEIGCQQRVRNSNCISMVYKFDTPDLIGTPRPQAERFDVGAWQSCPSTSANAQSRCARP